ncbi:hypothetical protein TGRUB_293650 [Toxoplasma gondii RUB]|uniref:Uncharacterized protein n=1 Tax=Toxoplasma gondii RUB TaxID=935652 RepID=A0A086LS39_TOXGO|nr:hypothetical protein TGRUB_293650 [Toxoplasma gondii RUB]
MTRVILKVIEDIGTISLFPGFIVLRQSSHKTVSRIRLWYVCQTSWHPLFSQLRTYSPKGVQVGVSVQRLNCNGIGFILIDVRATWAPVALMADEESTGWDGIFLRDETVFHHFCLSKKIEASGPSVQRKQIHERTRNITMMNVDDLGTLAGSAMLGGRQRSWSSFMHMQFASKYMLKRYALLLLCEKCSATQKTETKT